MIHTVILTKYQKYTSNKIIKNANVLGKADKLPYGILCNTTPHESYSITIHVRTIQYNTP